jgi:hypothetical protein
MANASRAYGWLPLDANNDWLARQHRRPNELASPLAAPAMPGACKKAQPHWWLLAPNVGAKGDSSGVTPGPEDRKCTPYLASGPGGTPLLLPLERLVRRHLPPCWMN